ncbi:protein of unassigned function [Methylobacterium oryzae CBMB20]|uniref:Protein of unassigned function n=2 Tax=Methylobacterium oryzae TaxID=334852 RepID=A0A089NQA3_9HYPH|nr:protein of unassigned function [Methylobacterium oryzae CBMB20]
MELRIVLNATDYADLCSLAKVSGLAASQYGRQVIKRHLARIYATAEAMEANT